MTITAYGADGKPLSGEGLQNQVQITVAAGQQFSRLTSELFGTPPNDPSAAAWFEATSSADDFTGFFLFLDLGSPNWTGPTFRPRQDNWFSV